MSYVRIGASMSDLYNQTVNWASGGSSGDSSWLTGVLQKADTYKQAQAARDLQQQTTPTRSSGGGGGTATSITGGSMTPEPQTGGFGLGSIPTWAWVLGGGLLLWKLKKGKRGRRK